MEWSPAGGVAGAITAESDPIAGAALTAHAALITNVHGVTGSLAGLASPALTGTPTAPTPTGGDNSTKIATTAFIGTALGSYATLASPALTGSPTAPTQTARDGSTKVATTAYVDGADQGNGSPNTQTGNYTLVLTDAGKTVETNSASAIVVTVPPNSSVAFPIGTIIELNRYGAGTATVAAGAGVTVRSRGALLAIGNQYGSVSLRKRATDEWVLVGDLA
jgi:hypothetical protein